LKLRKRDTFIKKRVTATYVLLNELYEVSDSILRHFPFGFLDQAGAALARGTTKRTVADSKITAFSSLRLKIVRLFINKLFN